MHKNTDERRWIEETKLVCDNCQADIDIIKYIHYDGHWTDWNDRFGDDADFCSVKCMVEFLKKDDFYIPPTNEDVRLEIPVPFLLDILAQLGE